MRSRWRSWSCRWPPSSYACPPWSCLGLRDEAAVDALLVSLKTSAVAHAFILVVGPRRLLPGHLALPRVLPVLTLMELLVLPPAVAGLALLATFGQRGLLGGTLDALGLSVSFTPAAVVLAVILVASPSTCVRRSLLSRPSILISPTRRGRSA